MPDNVATTNPQTPNNVNNIFPNGHWRPLALLRLYLRGPTRTAMINWGPAILFRALRFGHASTKKTAFRVGTEQSSLGERYRIVRLLEQAWFWLSWRSYFLFITLEHFEEDYMQAWQDALKQRGKVVQIHVFIGDQTMRVPILFDEKDLNVGSDQETFESLRMWYCLMMIKRGFGEIILPRQLVRIDRVHLCTAVEGLASLGSKDTALELGRNGSTHVANFENPMRIPADQRFQTALMLEDPTAKGAAMYGLEFVRAWDSTAVSIISLMPFFFSLAFAAVWIGVSVGTYGVDTQVAMQTAFTVAGFIVTAGALLIALFAFLDTQRQASE